MGEADEAGLVAETELQVSCEVLPVGGSEGVEVSGVDLPASGLEESTGEAGIPLELADIEVVEAVLVEPLPPPSFGDLERTPFPDEEAKQLLLELGVLSHPGLDLGAGQEVIELIPVGREEAFRAEEPGGVGVLEGFEPVLDDEAALGLSRQSVDDEAQGTAATLCTGLAVLS